MPYRRLATLCLAVLSIVSCGGSTEVEQVIRVLLDEDDATLEVGQTRQLNATVEGLAAGQATGVDFSSSAPTIATVDAAGLVSAIAAGSATITATAKADSRASATARFTVTPPSVAVEITSIVNATTGQPVDPGNVSGAIRVNVAVTKPNSSTATLELSVGSTLVSSQVIPAAGLRVASNALEALPDVQQIPLSINTLDFNELSGTPTFPNALASISARVTTPSGMQASSSRQVTLNNSSFIALSVESNLPSATDLSGNLWHTGAVTLKATPVLYGANGSSGVVNIVTVTATLPDNSVINKVDNTALDGFRVNFPNDLLPQNGGLQDFSGLLTFNARSTTASGASGPQSAPLNFRLDNFAPNGSWKLSATLPWINGRFKFDHTAITPSDPDLGGVNRVTYQFFYRRNSIESSSYTPVNSPRDIPQSVAANAYFVRANLRDALGLQRNIDGLAGIDFTDPLIARMLTSVRHGQINPPPGSDFAVTASDEHSGLRAYYTSITSTAPGGAISCANGTFNPMGNVCDKTEGPDMLPVPSAPGFHFYYGRAVDFAMNWSPNVKIGIVQDAVNPVLGTHTIATTTFGGPISLRVPGTDNLTIKSLNRADCYSINGVRGCFGVEQVVGSPFGPPLAPSVTANFTGTFAAGLERASASGALEGVMHPGDAILYDVIDHANNFAVNTINIPLTSLGPRSAPLGTLGIQNIQIISPVTSTRYGVGGEHDPVCAAGVLGQIDVQVDIRVAASTANPFEGIKFDLTDGRGISRSFGTSTTPVTSSDGTRITYRLQRDFSTSPFDVSPQTSVNANLSATATSATGALRTAPRAIVLENCHVPPPPPPPAVTR